MYSIQPVASYAELLDAIRHLPVKDGKHRMFRGQRRDFNGKMLVSSARRPSPRSLLEGLQTWLPAIDALHIAKRGGQAVSSSMASFTATGTSPSWASGITMPIAADLLHHPDVDRGSIEGSALMQHYGVFQ